MKFTITIFLFLFVFGLSYGNAQTKKSFYHFTVQDINGKSFKLKNLKGKKVLIVNVASKCGLTPQYTALQKIYEQYKNSGFTIIAFPANNFKEQEPGNNKEIREFCSLNYGVTFPLMSKISVSGSDIHPLYEWLTQKEKNGKLDAPVKWNFQKFMINSDGTLFDFVEPSIEPNCAKILNWIEK